MKHLKLFLVAVIACGVGIAVGNYYYQSTVVSYIFDASYDNITTEGFVSVQPGINGTTVHLTGDCYDISFDVTLDQAYSITKGVERTVASRPLTHDILKDILDNFGVEVLQIRIDRYINGIYYATIVLKQGNNILELDARPSDSIALALRTGNALYIGKTFLEANGARIC